MSRDLVIQVNVNPNTAPGPTQTTETTSVVSQTAVGRGTVAAAQVKQAMGLVAQNSFNFALTNIGELTGNRKLERRIQATNYLFTLGAIAKINPYAAVAMAGIQLGTSALSTAIENRNLRIEIDYQKTLRFNNYNNSRR